MATPAKRIALDAGNVVLTINRGINNGVSFGFQLYDSAAGAYIGSATSGTIHPLDPSPTQTFSLGPPGPLRGKRLVIAFRLSIDNPGDGNVYRAEADFFQNGNLVDTLDYDTQQASENGAYNELNAFFV